MFCYVLGIIRKFAKISGINDKLFFLFVLVSGDPVVVSEDEEYKKVNFDKFTTLKSVFQKDGTCI